MLEEQELDANTFWRNFDKECRTAFRGKGSSAYERSSLLVLFLWSEKLLIAPSLIQGGERRIEKEAQRWWVQVVHRLNEQLGLEAQERITEESVAIDFLTAAMMALSSFPEISARTAAFYFDYRFIRLAERETGIPRLLSHFSASLANTLNDQSSPFIDTYCTTGELFVTSGNERWRRRDDTALRGYLFAVGAFGLEVRMRLALHGREPRSLERITLPTSMARYSMLRIDPPPRKFLLSVRQDSDLDHVSSPTELLEQLQLQVDVRLSLIIVSGSERTSSRRALLNLRERMVQAGQLAAVIDFPRAPGARIEKSAWLIAPNSMRFGQDVLMINAGSLGDPSTHQEYGALAEFAGRIVKLQLGERLSSRWATSSREDSAAHYRYLFDREFSNGYRDVLGLCRLVSAEEIQERRYALLASTYVHPAPRNAWLSGIDGSPLLDFLFDRSGQGRTIYLIGNNGEGKSLLLREIAQASSERQRKTIGISCSPSDRFPLASEKAPGFENFTYEGARTSDQTANLKKLATDVCRKFLLVHKSNEHLGVFEEVLRLLDFNARRYLMPLSAAGSGPQSHNERLMAHTIELGNDAAVNTERTKGLNASATQVALMRSDSKGTITPFRDLSSGEQQIINLVTKIIAHAKQHCLYLVDEPEISLHVSWQRVLPTVLSLIARHFSCDFLIATHSPLLISSVSEESSMCFTARMQRLSLIDSHDRRSVESVLFQGFGTHTANNRLIHERCASIVAAAIGIVNAEQPDQVRLKSLLNELGEMRRRVSAASGQLDKTSIEKSLEVINAARRAINEITILSNQPDAEEEQN